MFHSGGKVKKHNVNKIIGKKPAQPINDLKIDKDNQDISSSNNIHSSHVLTSNITPVSKSNTDLIERSRHRKRSRSRTRKEFNSVFNSNSDDDGDGDGEDDNASVFTNEGKYNSEDNDDKTRDYVTTVSHNKPILQYSYSFVDNELEYNLSALDDEDIVDFEIVIYRINTNNNIPFLEFLLYYDKQFGKCTFPVYHKKRTSSQTLKMQIDNMLNQLFTTKYRYKGYIYDEITQKCYIFYEKYFDINYKPFLVLLQEAHNWFWVCSTEIINNRQYVNIPIDDSVTSMFSEHPQIMLLQEHFQDIEAPTILYTGANFCYTETLSKYGLRREPITSRYGPFYYFSDFRFSFRWGCYDYKNKNIMITPTSPNNDNEGKKYSSGGLTRYAVFPGKMKTVFIDDEYDIDVINQYKHNKSTFENVSIPKNTNYMEYLDKSSSFHSYDYSWAKEYNTIYNGSYVLDNKKLQHRGSGKHTDYELIKPFWCIYDYKQFEQLTYYCVDTSKIPESYDLLYENYTIL
jgi:hypothetical protein